MGANSLDAGGVSVREANSEMVRVSVDPQRRLAEQDTVTGHNRWHPALQPVTTIEDGGSIALETLDASDGQIRRGSQGPEFAKRLPLGHPLTGPVYVQGAKPGDVLEVEILGYSTASFAWSAFDTKSGLLADRIDLPGVVTWEIADGVARSDDLPGIGVPAATFAGVIGVAPSEDEFSAWSKREQDLWEKGGSVSLPETTRVSTKRREWTADATATREWWQPGCARSY